VYFENIENHALKFTSEFNTSWSVCKTLIRKALERTGRVLLACILLESFEKFSADSYYEPEPLLWFMILC